MVKQFQNQEIPEKILANNILQSLYGVAHAA